MKKALAISACAGMALLLFFSSAAAEAARGALTLWWRSVLPALFPFYVCADLLQSGGAFQRLSVLLKRPSQYLRIAPATLPCLLFGALFGFPAGARLCAQNGVPALAAFCNLCSPVFLLSVLAPLFGSRSFFWPVAIGHYGAALFCAACFLLAGGQKRRAPAEAHAAADAPFSLIDSIGEGMLVMLRIGGCIVLFSVLSALCEAAGLWRVLAWPAARFGIRAEAVSALLTGVLEFTSGCARVLACGVSPRMTAALCAALVSFGGLCVYFQARLFAKRAALKGYLPQKLLQALLAGVLSYLAAPRFLTDAIPVMEVSAETVRVNASGGAAMLGASAAGIAAAYLAGVLIRQSGRARGGRSRRR